MKMTPEYQRKKNQKALIPVFERLSEDVIIKELKDAGLIKLFEEMELPLSKVLSGMELLGIEVDTGRLEKLQLEMEGKLKDLTEELYRMAGYEFNIASPKQLSELLFTKLG